MREKPTLHTLLCTTYSARLFSQWYVSYRGLSHLIRDFSNHRYRMEKLPQKRIRDETPTGSKNDGMMHCPNCETLLGSNNTYLTYDVLRVIFQYLNARDLSSAAMVCRSWSEAANNEKSTRGPYCFVHKYEGKAASESLFKRIKDIRIKPSVGLFFISRNSEELMPDTVADCVRNLLPKNCHGIILATSGIIIDNTEIENVISPKIVCAFLPEIPNVKINTYKLTDYEADSYIPYYNNEIHGMLSRISLRNSESMCLMLFCDDMCLEVALFVASTLQTSTENGIDSLWGGVVECMQSIQHMPANSRCRMKNKRRRRTGNAMVANCIAVLITGAIQTWSVIIDKKCKTKEQVEAKLKLFKDQVKLQKHSMGFMFACKARGRHMYNGEKHVESRIFKTLFPKVPLVGCFGYGEFGKNTFIDEMNEQNSSKKKRKTKKIPLEPTWSNQFSTIFMILTYG